MPTSLQLHSKICSNAKVQLLLAEAEIPEVKNDDDIVVRVDACPVNPSDIASLLGVADPSTAVVETNANLATTTMQMPIKAVKHFATRLDKPLPVGIEGAGEVVAAGNSAGAKALLGKIVSFSMGGTYAQHAKLNYKQCMAFSSDGTDSVSADEAASSFVNPMTALGFIETMKAEGHKALINTAAASQLGQMLNRICMADGIDLINIVRKPEQVELLRGLGAKHVINSSDDNFMAKLIEAVSETGATIGFDAIGGGDMADKMLSAMERALAKNMAFYDHYGSSTYKQVYVYGGLQQSVTTLMRQYGFYWGYGAWLLFNFLNKTDPAIVASMKQRISNEIKTTFATSYTHKVSLREVITPETIQAFAKQATGEKFLLCPQK